VRNLRYQCPECGRKLASLSGAKDATQVVRRTCPGCQATWQIVVRPIRSLVGWLDIGTFAKITRCDTSTPSTRPAR
jgi:hypothetical protein